MTLSVAEHTELEYLTPLDEKFATYTEWRQDCLEWTGGKRNKDGYGALNMNGRTYMAHRVAWERVHGKIPKGLVIDHKCHNPPCVFIDHLRLATRKQNSEHLKPTRRNNTSGYRGVSWSKANGKWVVQVSVDGKSKHFGSFVDKEEAAAHAEKVRNELFTYA